MWRPIVFQINTGMYAVHVDTGMLIQLSEGLDKQITEYEKDIKKVRQYEKDGLTYNDVSRLFDPKHVPTPMGNKPFDAQEDIDFLTTEIARMTALRDQMRKVYS
jgi:hypothetical protein